MLLFKEVGNAGSRGLWKGSGCAEGANNAVGNLGIRRLILQLSRRKAGAEAEPVETAVRRTTKEGRGESPIKQMEENRRCPAGAACADKRQLDSGRSQGGSPVFGLVRLFRRPAWGLILAFVVFVGASCILYRLRHAFANVQSLSRTKCDPHKSLILFVSTPNATINCSRILRFSDSDKTKIQLSFDLSKDIKELDDLYREKPKCRWNWQQMMRAIKPHILPDKRLRRLHLSVQQAVQAPSDIWIPSRNG